MPPKKTEATQEEKKSKNTLVPVFDLDKLNPALLPELATFKEKQLKIVEDNPFVEIIDTASRELAKKHRTNRVSARTSLQAQDKLISSKFNEAKTKAKTYIAELIAYTQPGEIEQQKEIDRDEAVLEAKRQEKARLEQARIDNIKNLISDYAKQWEVAFNLMIFDTIDEVSATFLASYTEYDTAPLEEFEVLFVKKVEELTQTLSSQTAILRANEETRIEKENIRLQAEKLAKDKAEFEAKQKEQDDADAKAKKEREDFEKEKADFEEKQAEAKRQEELAKQRLFDAEVKAKQEAEAKIIDKVEIAEVLVEEIPTVNVSTTLKNKREVTNTFPYEAELTPLTPKECFAPVTWEDIIEEFKTSGEKSYSKFLIDNYNVPTKIQA